MAQSVSQKQLAPDDVAVQRAKSRKALERLVATDPQMRQAAREAASKAGISIGEFLNRLAEQMDGRLEREAAPARQPADAPDAAASDEKPASNAPFGAARAMMGELKERVDYVERAMGRDSSDEDVAGSGQDDRHWSDRLEDMARQIERSEQYMIGGLMTVEEVMANLAERTRLLEKNKANASKLAQLMESFAAQFFVYRDDTNARLESIDTGLSHLNVRVDDLASNANHEPSSSETGRGRLSEALSQKTADDAHWGTTENPGLNRLKRFAADRARAHPDEHAAASDPSAVHADDLIDPPSVGAVEIGGVQYSLPVPSDNDEPVDADLIAEDAAQEAHGEAENTDTSLFDPARQLAELDDDDDRTIGFEDLSSDTALRNFLKRTREQGDYSDDFDTSYDDQEQRTVHMRGVIAVVVGFAFLALVAAAYLLMMDMGPSSGPRLNPNQPGSEPGTGSYSQEGAVSPETFPGSSSNDTAAHDASGEAGEYALYGQQDLDELNYEGGEDPLEAPLGPPLSAPGSMADESGAIADADTAAPETMLETASLADIGEVAGETMSADEAAAVLVRGVHLMTGVETERDPQRGAQLIRQAAAAGSASAQYHLGALYEQGLVVNQDYQQAVDWYTQAAEAGNRKAMHNLAVLYTEGMGVVRDYRVAAHWFEKAANLGLTDSQYNLGILYARGLGVAEDPIEAYKWFEVLARAGDADARKKAEGLAASMDSDTLDVAIDLANRWQQLPLDPTANNEHAL